jgi:hypothetical protein
MENPSPTRPNPICHERVVGLTGHETTSACILANQTKVVLSRILASNLAIGDEISFPISTEQSAGTEILITKSSARSSDCCLYQAPIGYVGQPKVDKRGQHFVQAEVRTPGLGMNAVFLPCSLLREYFYRLPEGEDSARCPTLYQVLRAAASASPAELRIAFKLRDLELLAAGATRAGLREIERAFNILGHPDLRAGYDQLLSNADTPATFPYGGFGSLFVAGEVARGGQSFFARRILAFLPQRTTRHFHMPLRQCDFYDGCALGRDVRRKLEFWLDPTLLNACWDSTWNQWKHLLPTKLEVEATFVESGKYRKRRGAWELVHWETALPTRLAVKLPTDFAQQVEVARNSYHRFGQYSRALDRVRMCLEHRALEKSDLERLCAGLRIPGDFDVSQINWRADYDPFFYAQLARRARRIYLFRREYIFEVEGAVVVETPQLGHASYVFAKPRSMESFLHLYTRVSKQQIRHNRENAAAQLGFLGRVIHGDNPRVWLKEIRQRIGEKLDFATSLES